MKYFVSADVHGFFDEWIYALEEKRFNMDNPEHMLIVCGDLFDRGNKAKELQRFVMKMLDKNKIILVRGNHEDLALEMIENYVNYMFNIKSTHHYHNGTFQTFIDLTGMNYNDATTCLWEFKRLANQTDYVKNIIPRMQNFYQTERYVFVHSWIPLVENAFQFNSDWQNADDKLWAKARWLNPVELYNKKLYPKDKTLVFGHWHCSAFWANMDRTKYSEFGKNACFEPFITKEIIALDACTVLSKKVNVVVLED